MIVLNGKKFTKTQAEFCDSIFHRDGSCVGFYRRTKAGVLFMDMHKNPMFFARDDNGSKFFIDCSRVGKKIYYSYSKHNVRKFYGLPVDGNIDFPKELNDQAMRSIFPD